jgi:putative ABC transport system permease protein
MNIAFFLVKDIFRKKLRAILTILGISVGVCVCIIMLGIGESIKHSFKDVYGKRQIDIVIEENEQLSILLSRINANVSHKLKAMPQVEDAGSILLYIHKMKKAAVPVFGWESGPFLFEGVELTQGRLPATSKKEAMVGDALMRTLAKQQLKQIKIKGQVFDIVGVFKSSSPFEQSAVVIPLEELQDVLHQTGQASFINVKLKPAFRNEPAIESLLKELEESIPTVTAMRADAFVSEKTKFIVVGEQFSLLISLITIIAVALGLANTMIASGFEKKKFLAILLALGWPKIAIGALFVCESVVISFLGGALGIFMGFKVTGYIFSSMSIQAFVPQLSLAFIIKVVMMLLTGALFAGLVPAWITLNSNPVEVIRSE